MRGAVARLRRWFYATHYSKVMGEAREISKENWAKLARLLVEKSNEMGVSDKGGRIILYYYIKDGVFIPVRAEIEVYELKLTGKFEITV